MTARVRIVIVIGVASLAFIVYKWGTRQHPVVGDGAVVLSPAPRATLSVTNDNAQALVRQIVAEAEHAWIAAGLDAALAYELAEDSTQVLDILVLNDFDAYLRFFRERDGQLSTRAFELAKHYRNYGYKSVDDALWEAMSDEEKVRYVWEHPQRRGAEWKQVGPENVRVWLGALPAALPPGASVSGMLSMFDVSGHERLIADGADEQAPVAWLEFPVTFGVGSTLLVRFEFAYIEEQEAWVPVRMETVGTGRRPGLLF